MCGVIGFGGILIALASRSLEPAAVAAPFLAVIMLSITDGWWRPAQVAAAEVSSPRVIEGDQLSFTIDVRVTEPVPWVEVEVQFPAMLDPIGPARFVAAIDELETDLNTIFNES